MNKLIVCMLVVCMLFCGCYDDTQEANTSKTSGGSATICHPRPPTVVYYFDSFNELAFLRWNLENGNYEQIETTGLDDDETELTRYIEMFEIYDQKDILYIDTMEPSDIKYNQTEGEIFIYYPESRGMLIRITALDNSIKADLDKMELYGQVKILGKEVDIYKHTKISDYDYWVKYDTEDTTIQIYVQNPADCWILKKETFKTLTTNPYGYD